MKTKAFIIYLLTFTFYININAQGSTNKSQEVYEILKSYCDDFKKDRFAVDPMYFGVEIPEVGSWTINVTGKKKNKEWEVILTEGLPVIPTFYYSIELETFEAISKGEINALTAQGKAFSGDYTPMSVKNMEGFELSKEEDAKINPFSFHFWTRGFPESIPFAEGMTRRAHGSNFVVFYYETGLRTAWYRILPGERVRDDVREQATPFPMMGIIIKGTIEGEVGGKRVTYTEGNTSFIPANVPHKWWNESDEVVEVILVMFGKGA